MPSANAAAVRRHGAAFGNEGTVLSERFTADAGGHGASRRIPNRRKQR
jgi:hypothetical protein